MTTGIHQVLTSVGARSGKLRKTLPQIFAENGAFYARHAQIIAAVRAVFEGERPRGDED